jgi:hypothetical protein
MKALGQKAGAERDKHDDSQSKNAATHKNIQSVTILKKGYNNCVNHQYLKKFSYGFWDNQRFGRNQIYLKLKLGARQFMPGIKNLN